MSVSPQFSLPTQIGQYNAIEVIGTGAFACVYKAIRDGISYAMKIITKQLVSDPQDQNRLQREIDATAVLHHPNITALVDFFQDDTYYYLVLEYCPGGSLSEYLSKTPKLRESQAAYIFKQMVEAINYCHQHGVAHRDLKPQNILITSFPDIKLSDFGLCGYMRNDTKLKTFCGSPCYSAPECLQGVQYDGHLSDVWSMGVILFEMTTGTYPWHVNNMPRMVQEILRAQFTIPKDTSPALAELIRGLLRVRPLDRLKCDKLISHPWLRLAQSKKRSNSVSDNSHLPPLSCSVEDFTKTLHREKKNGVQSPFSSTTDLQRKLPIIRSGSLNKAAALQLQQTHAPKSLHIPLPPNRKNTDSSPRK